MIPKRLKRPRMQAPKPEAPIICPGHKKWTRGMECCVSGVLGVGPLGTGIGRHECCGRMHAHHVRSVGAGGGDSQVVPVCALAHKNIHDGCCFDVDLGEIAKKLWDVSPHGIKFRRNRMEQSNEIP